MEIIAAIICVSFSIFLFVEDKIKNRKKSKVIIGLDQENPYMFKFYVQNVGDLYVSNIVIENDHICKNNFIGLNIGEKIILCNISHMKCNEIHNMNFKIKYCDKRKNNIIENFYFNLSQYFNTYLDLSEYEYKHNISEFFKNNIDLCKKLKEINETQKDILKKIK